jgi:hypothetical protein
VTGPEHVWQEPRHQPGNPALVPENAVPTTIERPVRAHGHLHLAVLVVAFVAAASIVAWLALHRTNGTATVPAGGPVLLSQARLEQLAASADHPLYWAGPKSGYSYEATLTGSGRFYVRYLPRGVRAGDPRAAFLAVATYLQPGSYKNLQHAATQRDAVSVGIDRGGLAVYSAQRATSVYFSYPGAKYQVEVYSPSADTARGLVLGQKITPIPAR